MTKAAGPPPPVVPLVVPLVVPDVNVLVQSLIGPAGPAVRVFHAAWDKRIELVRSDNLVAELRDTLDKPRLRSRFPAVAAGGDDLVAEYLALARHVRDVPRVFDYRRDPNDAYLVDLAVAAGASVITSHDNDLLDLMRDNPDGRDFRRRFPAVEVLTPPELLGRLVKAGVAE